jgi:hypothetical protein
MDYFVHTYFIPFVYVGMAVIFIILAVYIIPAIIKDTKEEARINRIIDNTYLEILFNGEQPLEKHKLYYAIELCEDRLISAAEKGEKLEINIKIVL